MQRFLITGASSYPGRQLTAHLLNQGADVHILIRPGTNRDRLAKGLPFKSIHESGGNTEDISQIVSGIVPDTVFHLAGLYRRESAPADVKPLIESNMLFGVQLCEALKDLQKPVHFINTGSFAQFYESDAPRALNLYAALKQAFESTLCYYRDAHGFKTTTLILQDVYGPGDWRVKLIAAIAKAQATGEALPLPDGEVRIDLVYIDDVVTAFATAAKLLCDTPAQVDGKQFYVGGGGSVLLNDVVTAFENVTGQPVKTRAGAYALPARRINVPWLGQMLPGWTPSTGLEDGIRHYMSAWTGE